MEEGSSRASAHHPINFAKSLNELRDLSSQLYHIADYCETAFYSSHNKNRIVESTKDYVSQAVVTVVDHLGTISATLELTISQSSSVLEAQCRIDTLKQRIGTCQQHSHKLALARFRWNTEFSRFHCRYIWSPLNGSATTSSVSRLSGTNACKNYPVRTPDNDAEEDNNRGSPSVSKLEDNKNLLPVHDEHRTFPKPEHLKFQLQESRKPKRSTIKMKVVQNKDLAAALIRRGKQILA